MTEVIAAAGAGRMGQGLAVVFALAGYPTRLVDLKQRPDPGAYLSSAMEAIRETLATLSVCGLFPEDRLEAIAARITLHSDPAALSNATVIFEGAPETLPAKQAVLEVISRHAPADAVIASTTSTILSDDLQGMVTGPERFLNAHWLNPAYLVPLVELSPGAATDPDVTDRLKALLEGIGKVPVVCAASPGFIVPRLQMLMMNEAARLVEEGVATPEDIDKATLYGLGFRFANLGVLEFIDWGGGDILAYASRYMTEATGEDRFAAPEIVERNMAEGRLGLRTRSGFLDYEGRDIPAYQRDKLQAIIAMLAHLRKGPKIV